MAGCATWRGGLDHFKPQFCGAKGRRGFAWSGCASVPQDAEAPTRTPGLLFARPFRFCADGPAYAFRS